MSKKTSPLYVLFYILFLPDSWQIVIGIIASIIFAPQAITPETGGFGSAMMYIMIATIGYAASRPIGRGITNRLKKWMLGDRLPRSS